MPNFRRQLCFFFFFLISYRLERSLYIKLKDRMSNSIGPDETAYYEPSHLDLCCLQKPIIIACGSERVKLYCKWRNRELRSSSQLFFPEVHDRNKRKSHGLGLSLYTCCIFLRFWYTSILLLSHMFYFTGVDGRNGEHFNKRTELFDQLVSFFPENMTQPKGNLVDLIPFWVIIAQQNTGYYFELWPRKVCFMPYVHSWQNLSLVI